MARALAAIVLAAAVVAGAAGSATPQRGGTLVLERSPPPFSCLNPFAQCSVSTADAALTQVLEGAFEVGPDLVYRPNLVSRVTIGRNPFTLTYRIRPEARWSDGTPVSAADFRFTHRVFATHPTSPDLRESYARIRHFRVLGPKAFRVELREPFAEWRGFFGLVLPEHALRGEDVPALWRDRIVNPKTGRPIGSGPFLVERLEPGRQLTLVRNPRYWGPRTAHLHRLVFRLGAHDAADPLGPLRRNETDFTVSVPGLASPIGPDLAREVRRIPGWRVVAWPQTSKEQLVFRVGPGGHPALRSRLVRRALAYAIDRAELARRVNADLGSRARPLDSTVFFADERFYRPNWRGYRHDPAQARRLLERAGCRRGADGVYSCAGARLRLRIVTTAGVAHREHALRLVQADLRDAGVDVQPVFAPGPALFRTILPRGEFDVALFAWFRAPGGGPVPESRCGHEQNWSGYCSRLVTRDVQQVDRIVDPGRRARVLNAADAKLVAAVPVIPLFQGVAHAAISSRFRGFVAGGSHFEFHENSEDWWRAR